MNLCIRKFTLTAYCISILIPLILASSLTATESLARDVVYGKAKETVLIPFGVETLFRFPIEVKTITEASRFEIRPANQEEPDYSVLVVKPRMIEGSADVTFLLSDGSMVKTFLIVSNKPNLKRDSIYDFKPRDELLSSNLAGGDATSGAKRDPMVISELDLLRAMVRGDQVAGFDVSNHSLGIPIGSQNLSATLVKVYRGKDINGYIYRLKVESQKHYFEVDLKSLSLGNPNLAVLSQIDRKSIGGEKEEVRTTYLRVIAKPGITAGKVILPVAIRQELQPKSEMEIK